MNSPYLLILILFSFLVAGCSVFQTEEEVSLESVEEWENRAMLAWSSMTNDSNIIDDKHLMRAFAQNGMSSHDSVTFVLYPRADDSLSIKNLKVSKSRANAKSSSVSDSDLSISRIGRAYRITVADLMADTEYFLDIDGLPNEESINLRARTAPAPNQSSDASIVLLSCNEPWSRTDNKSVYPRVAPSTANALRLLDLRASGALPVFIDGMESKRPSFLLGLGDQVYVDAEPTKKGSLSLFEGARSDELRIDIKDSGDWDRVLETVYRMHLLVPTMDSALRSLPNAMVWDDHEIRDGWGSQGDESREISNADGLKWKDYFEAARKKTWEFEASRNPNAAGQSIDRFDIDPERELDTSFEWGSRLTVFMMDTRTERETTEAAIRNDSETEQPVISDLQQKRLNKWLDTKDCNKRESRVYLLGLPVPLALDRESSLLSGTSAHLEEIFDYRSELSDDVIDGWGWRGHKSARDNITKALKDHAKTCPDDRIVIASGDVHESGVYAHLDKGKVYAYEIISSGVGTLIDKVGVLNKAQMSTIATTILEDVVQIGRIAGGASFAELFVNTDANRPPEVKVLFYSTTGASVNQELKSTLVNAAPWVERQRVWSTGSTSVQDLFEGERSVFVTVGNSALQLDYGDIKLPREHPRGTNYGLTSAAVRCEIPGSNVLEGFASDWVTVKEDLGKCR